MLDSLYWSSTVTQAEADALNNMRPPQDTMHQLRQTLKVRWIYLGIVRREGWVYVSLFTEPASSPQRILVPEAWWDADPWSTEWDSR